MTLNANAAFQPAIRFLSEAGKQKIYDSALQVIERIGMRVLQADAAALLKSAGCRPAAEEHIRIPAKLVQNAVASAPENIVIYNRDGEPAMDLGGRRSYFGTGSDLIYALDATQMARHRCRLADVRRAARVCDALPNIDFIMSFAHPSEIEPGKAYLESFRAMAANSVKPIVCTAEGRRDLAEIWEIARILRGDENALRSKPYWIHYAEPISPLKHPVESLEKLLFCAEKRMPVVYSPAPIAGMSAPITIAGHLVQGLAESLFGLVIHQLRAEGAPFLIGMGPAVLDLVSMQCSYNAPEYLMAYVGMVEMSRFLKLPNWGYAGTSDSQLPDGQAVYEAGLLTFMSAAAGSNLNHDVGYLDFGRTGALVMVVILDEVIDQIRRMQRGIPVDDEEIALPVIEEAGRSGDYLMHPHTFEHMQATQWRPTLIDRKGFDAWEKEGQTDLLTRARKKLDGILSDYRPPPLPEAQARAIAARVAAFEAEGS
jgi:trimethylamine--corrinoid protein Co-methyltransferase